MARYRFDGSNLGLAGELVLERNEDGTVKKAAQIGEDVNLTVEVAEAMIAAGLRLTRLDGSRGAAKDDDDNPPPGGASTSGAK